MKKVLIILIIFCLCISSVWAAVDFDGSDDYINIGSDVAGQGDYTVAGWFNADTASSNDVVYSDRGNDGFCKIMRVEATDTFTCYHGACTGTFVSKSGSITTGEWTHFACRFDGTNLYLFLDGVKSTAQSASNPTGAAINDTSIGRQEQDDVEYFDGMIGEIAVWSNDLTDAEVALYYNSRTRHLPLQLQPSNLQAYWTLDQGVDGTTSCFDGAASYLDISGNNNHGTGVDGANNTGLTCKAEEVLSYP